MQYARLGKTGLKVSRLCLGAMTFGHNFRNKERNTIRGDINISAKNLWYHPSVLEYKWLLENNGFNVTSIKLYERLTPLSGGEDGFAEWVRFVKGFGLLNSVPENLHEDVIEIAEDIARETLYKNGGWHADHKRIIFKAVSI